MKKVIIIAIGYCALTGIFYAFSKLEPWFTQIKKENLERKIKEEIRINDERKAKEEIEKERRKIAEAKEKEIQEKRNIWFRKELEKMSPRELKQFARDWENLTWSQKIELINRLPTE